MNNFQCAEFLKYIAEEKFSFEYRQKQNDFCVITHDNKYGQAIKPSFNPPFSEQLKQSYIEDFSYYFQYIFDLCNNTYKLEKDNRIIKVDSRLFLEEIKEILKRKFIVKNA